MLTHSRHMEGGTPGTPSAQNPEGVGIGGLRQFACHSCRLAPVLGFAPSCWLGPRKTPQVLHKRHTALCLSCALHNAGVAVGPCST